jgi:hypothetical protein
MKETKLNIIITSLEKDILSKIQSVKLSQENIENYDDIRSLKGIVPKNHIELASIFFKFIYFGNLMFF